MGKKVLTKRAFILAAVLIILAIVLWQRFLPDLFAGQAAASDISRGTVSLTGKSDILIAYFSRTGNTNYTADVDAVSAASITAFGNEYLGNAEVLARMAQEATGGDCFFIEVTEKYPEGFNETRERTLQEQSQDARPELNAHVENMDAYDTVVLAYPIWWGVMPQPVLTFLEEYDFSNKAIIPIATSESSGLSSSRSQIITACPGAKVAEGITVNGRSVRNAASEVRNCLKEAGTIL
jgi:flavodoxin